MGHSVTQLTQSRYYSPAFNAAVFDGPIRIYFAQHQEPLALNVYFRMQQFLKERHPQFRQTFKQSGQTVFLMLYPTIETFENSFSKSNARIVREPLGDDHVLGVRGPLVDDEYESVFQVVDTILQGLPQVELESAL